LYSTKYYQLYSYGDFNRIIVELVEKAKTGKCLAEEIGKTPCAVSKWCSNTTQPDLQTLDKIAKMLDVNVKELLNDTEKI
jgi:transcriptional regulator with XRE-family HTH domain